MNNSFSVTYNQLKLKTIFFLFVLAKFLLYTLLTTVLLFSTTFPLYSQSTLQWRTYSLWSLSVHWVTWANYYSQTLHFSERNPTLWHHKSHLNIRCLCMGTRFPRDWGCWGAWRVVIFVFTTLELNIYFTQGWTQWSELLWSHGWTSNPINRADLIKGLCYLSLSSCSIKTLAEDGS